MDPNDLIDGLLAMREAMQEERDEQEQILLQLRAREIELTAVIDGKKMQIAAQEETIKQKQKENDDQSVILEELIKHREELDKEMAGLSEEASGSAPSRRAHDDDDSESTPKKKPRTAGDDEEEEGTSSTTVPDKVSGLPTATALGDDKQDEKELEQNNII